MPSPCANDAQLQWQRARCCKAHRRTVPCEVLRQCSVASIAHSFAAATSSHATCRREARPTPAQAGSASRQSERSSGTTPSCTTWRTTSESAEACQRAIVRSTASMDTVRKAWRPRTNQPNMNAVLTANGFLFTTTISPSREPRDAEYCSSGSCSDSVLRSIERRRRSPPAECPHMPRSSLCPHRLPERCPPPPRPLRCACVLAADGPDLCLRHRHDSAAAQGPHWRSPLAITTHTVTHTKMLR